MIAIGLILGLGKFTPIFPFLFQHVPTFDMFHGPVRIMVWVVFSLALLAAVACEKLWRRPVKRGLYWTRLATAGGVAVTIGAFLGWYFLREVNVTFIKATAFAGLWGVGAGVLTLMKPIGGTSEKRRLVWQVGAILWVSLDLLVAGWWINLDVHLQFYAPSDGQSELAQLAGEGRVYQSLTDNYRLKFKRFVRLKNYRPVEPVSTMREISLPNINLLDEIAFANNFDPFSPQRYMELMEKIDGLPEEELGNWLAVMNVSVYEKVNPNMPLGVEYVTIDARDRFEMANCVQEVPPDEAWQVFADMLTDGQEYCTVIEVDGHLPESGAGGNTELLVSQDQPGRVQLSVENENDGWLVMRDVWYPGWQAEIDGKRTEIYQADHVFMAVPVPAGEHVISFGYRPNSFTIGIIFSMIGVIAVYFLAGKTKRTEY